MSTPLEEKEKEKAGDGVFLMTDEVRMLKTGLQRPPHLFSQTFAELQGFACLGFFFPFHKTSITV